MRNTDDELIKKARAGSPGAFKKLVEAYYEMVYAVAYGVLGNREESKDTTQEVFLKVFREIYKFEGKSKFSSWLYRITVNAAIDLARKRRPYQSLEKEEVEEEGHAGAERFSDPHPGPREMLSKEEEKQMVNRALEQLTPEHRAVLVLREWEDLSYEEIAEALGIDRGTVMSRLHYGRKKLAEILEVMFKEEDEEK
jgi:RNA polymerase sigma-70 factor (ECF subfamily)